MKLTVIGCGDAFGSGGRFNTCFHLATGIHDVLVDCGASSSVALKARGIDANTIDAIILSHLHGDHFGGIPFLILDGQYLSRREKPLLIAGPPGTAERVPALLEVFFPKSVAAKYRFAWNIQEIPVGEPTDVLDLRVTSTEVIHSSGAPSTGLRISNGETLFAYSGDTQWTDALFPIAADADLFVVECYDYDRELTGHMNWRTLKQRLTDFTARRVMITHMNPTMLARRDEAAQAGVLVAEDGLVLDV
jgi:ribonuclease BN (tRNA processing enzyme)